MKILILTNNCAPYSGWGRYSGSVLKEYEKRGVDFTVLSEAKKLSLTQEKNILVPAASIKNLLKNIVLIRKMAKEYDIVHAFDGWPYGIYGYLSVLGTKKRLIINGVGTYSVGAFSSLLKGFLLRRAYMRSASILCISNYTRDRILDHVPCANAKTVFLGTTYMAPISDEKKQTFEDHYKIGNAHPIIVTVGAIKHRKGQLDTLKAVELLKKKYPTILYCMIGARDDEAYAKKIEQMINDHSLQDNARIITDAKSDDALAFFYQSADIFALNSNNDKSHFEGFGLVFLEANQFGVPGIGSKNCGIEDAVEDGVSGYLSEQGNAKNIAEKIDLIMQKNKNYWQQNTKIFAKKFDWTKTAKGYLEAYLSS